MQLDDLVNRVSSPLAWEEGDNIPWNDPEFSRRMLKQHLSQDHDAASRRFEIIDQHVKWIHSKLLNQRSTKILDLACGPGLYSERLARLGHICYGIDYSPASIEYAKTVSDSDHLSCNYVEADIRQAQYPQEVGLVMLIYGELNVFRPAEAQIILRKAYQALEAGGWLLLEPHPFEVVHQLGERPPRWYSSTSGLFSDQPHLVLQENFWDEHKHTATMRYYIIDAISGAVTRHAQSMQAYRDEDYRSLLASIGFSDVQILPGMTDSNTSGELFVLVGRKPAI